MVEILLSIYEFNCMLFLEPNQAFAVKQRQNNITKVSLRLQSIEKVKEHFPTNLKSQSFNSFCAGSHVSNEC